MTALTVSTNEDFNLIGDITEFLSLEGELQNSVKPFQGNTNLKKLINFKINYNDRLNRVGDVDWLFWQNQFSGCSELESADIIFDIPNGAPAEGLDGFVAKITNLFAGCSKLSYIRVRDTSHAYMMGGVSNDWLVANDLPNYGTLIVPADIDQRESEQKNNPFTLDDINYFDDFFLAISIVRRLLEKGWTIKFE